MHLARHIDRAAAEVRQHPAYRRSKRLGNVPGKGWVPYVHPAKVAELESEIARLTEALRVARQDARR